METLSFLDRFVTFSLLTENCRRVQDRETGKMALLHWVPASSDMADALSQAPVVIARREEGGTIYVVTEDKPELTDLRAWLEERSTPAATNEGEFTRLFKTPGIPSALVDEAPQTSAGGGEFTRLFQAPINVPVETPDTPASAVGPGEFTQMFQTPVARAATPAPSQPMPDKPAAADEYHESRNLFRIPVVPSPPADEKPLPAGSQVTKLFEIPAPTPPDPGEFNDFFTPQYRASAESFEEKLASSAARQPETPVERDPGDFTRLFGRPAASPPRMESNAAGATGVFAAPKPVERQQQFVPPSQGPGEYTRILQRPANPAVLWQTPLCADRLPQKACSNNST